MSGSQRQRGRAPGGGDAPDLVAGILGEPQRPVRARRDAGGLAAGRGNREFGDGASGRDPSNFVCARLDEP